MNPDIQSKSLKVPCLPKIMEGEMESEAQILPILQISFNQCFRPGVCGLILSRTPQILNGRILM